MSGPDQISTTEELRARLAEMRRTGGDPAAFEEATRSLASSLTRPLNWTAVLKLARVGLECYSDFPELPSAAPPVFEGRPAAELPSVARTTLNDGPRRQPLADESVVDYGNYLAEHLARWVTSQGFDVSEDERSASLNYVAVLARDDFRRTVGWERSLDAHAVMMLTAEISLRQMGSLDLSGTTEEAFFRWLHLATYAEVTPEHLREVAARREIRRSHQHQPAGEVAVMVCQTPLVEPFPYEALTDALRAGMPFSAEQLRYSFRDLAERAGDNAERWAARARGFDDTGELNLTFGAEVGEPELDAYAAGHLIRWMLNNEIPIGPARLASWGYYAEKVAEILVLDPVREGREQPPAAHGHDVALHLMRKLDGPVPLSEELVLLAWLASQRKLTIRLPVWLEHRETWLAKA